jgi:predicted metalloprotease with PDZ domain
MKICSAIVISLLSSQFVVAQSNYKVKVDLTKTNNDRLNVEISTPKVPNDQIAFHVPKIVPGTYSISNFGSFVSNFKAFDKQGGVLVVEHPDPNTWNISGAKKLGKVTYDVDDTWDTPEIKEDVFEPGGTSFEKDSAFVLNTFGLIGYFCKAWKRSRLELR